MSNTPQQTLINKIIDSDPRYPADVYLFLENVVAETSERLFNQHHNDKHITAAELVFGVADSAYTLFGPLALDVLTEWNLRTSSDIGNVVYNMILVSLLRASPEDTKEDFDHAPDLQQEVKKRIPVAKDLNSKFTDLKIDYTY